MRVAYLDCQSGVSGDMFLAACVDAGADFDVIQAGIDSLGTNNCRLEKRDVKKFGFRALKVSVLHEPEHAHRHLHHIHEMIDQSSITERQKELAKAIFQRLAEAEANVHGSTLEKVHFHEVGAIDSIADIVGGAIAWDLLEVDRLVCSPIPTGGGQIKIAHGNVSVPAPATAELLKGIPLKACDIEAELTTPTGAAIVATLAESYGGLPAMEIETVGVGAGTRDLEEQANVLRLTLGTSATELPSSSLRQETVTLLETNLDDVTPEVIGFTHQALMDAGALDVYSTSIQMKKNRPGVLLSVLCHSELTDRCREILFRETATLGIREQAIRRTILFREPYSVETKWGSVAGKLVTNFDGTAIFTPEHDHCAQLAKENQVSLVTIYEAARAGFSRNKT